MRSLAACYAVLLAVGHPHMMTAMPLPSKSCEQVLLNTPVRLVLARCCLPPPLPSHPPRSQDPRHHPTHSVRQLQSSRSPQRSCWLRLQAQPLVHTPRVLPHLVVVH